MALSTAPGEPEGDKLAGRGAGSPGHHRFPVSQSAGRGPGRTGPRWRPPSGSGAAIGFHSPLRENRPCDRSSTSDPRGREAQRADPGPRTGGRVAVRWRRPAVTAQPRAGAAESPPLDSHWLNARPTQHAYLRDEPPIGRRLASLMASDWPISSHRPSLGRSGKGRLSRPASPVFLPRDWGDRLSLCCMRSLLAGGLRQSRWGVLPSSLR